MSSECREVQIRDMPVRHTQIQDVRGGGETMVYSNRVNLPRAD